MGDTTHPSRLAFGIGVPCSTFTRDGELAGTLTIDAIHHDADPEPQFRYLDPNDMRLVVLDLTLTADSHHDWPLDKFSPRLKSRNGEGCELERTPWNDPPLPPVNGADIIPAGTSRQYAVTFRVDRDMPIAILIWRGPAGTFSTILLRDLPDEPTTDLPSSFVTYPGETATGNDSELEPSAEVTLRNLAWSDRNLPDPFTVPDGARVLIAAVEIRNIGQWELISMFPGSHIFDQYGQMHSAVEFDAEAHAPAEEFYQVEPGDSIVHHIPFAMPEGRIPSELEVSTGDCGPMHILIPEEHMP